jgi:DNA modification methylase
MLTPSINDSDVRIWHGDVIECLREMPDGIAQTCVTSPPYWGLRDYGADGQIGLEATPDEYVKRIVEVFREVRRVLRDDGTLWLNLGDSYAGSGPSGASYQSETTKRREAGGMDGSFRVSASLRDRGLTYAEKKPVAPPGLKPKDLVGIPWRVAFALQADGWYLRSDIIWHKPNPMPESVTDRPTKSHEYVFLLSKSARYYYDAEAIRESGKDWSKGGPSIGIAETHHYGPNNGGNGGLKNLASRYKVGEESSSRNARSVWTITTKPYAEAHFATFPIELPERCIKAGSREGDTILDPFMGSGTTAWVARHLGRQSVGCELNADYLQIAARRLSQQSLLAEGAAGVATTTAPPASRVL